MSLDYKPGDTVYAEFTTQVFSTGVATNADSPPVGTVNKNGTDDGAVTVTVTNIDTGRYKATFVVPTTYIPGDVLNLTIAATVSSVAGKACIWRGKLGIGNSRQFDGVATSNGTTTTIIDSTLSTLTESLINRVVVFKSPRLAAAQITAHTPGTSTFTFANQPLVNSTVTGDAYSVF